MDYSEFDTPPLRFVMHHPGHGHAIASVAQKSLEQINFLALPDTETLLREYEKFSDVLQKHVQVTYLNSLLAEEITFQSEANTNPNLMFCRDSAITLPWAPRHFIPARLALSSRMNESAIMAGALQKLGMTPLLSFTDDEYVEGGDVLPTMDQGKRLLLVGFGNRTTKAAAMKMAMKLIPDHVDQVIGLSHDPELLHLDTGFTVLPNRVMFAAAGMFHSGFMFDENRQLHDVDPIETAKRMGFNIITCSKEEAIIHERCNMLPLGHGKYLAFDMPDATRDMLQNAAHITIQTITGRELAKAAGGVHCLTRPVYI